MNIHGKKIGIWGFGVVGKAALPYLATVTDCIQILDIKDPSSDDRELIASLKATFLQQDNKTLAHFLESNDFILASPGIDLKPFQAFKHKWLSELDLLQQDFKKPIITVTGSVGKTTVTTILSQIFASKSNLQIYTGGNIGKGMLEILQKKSVYDAALLEVSSFQLEHCTSFAPSLAIWTTFYPNHLDRHGSEKEYFDAKFNSIRYQQENQYALVPLSIADNIATHTSNTNYFFFAPNIESYCNRSTLPKHQGIFTIIDNMVVLLQNHTQKKLFDISILPLITFSENWLIIIATLHIMQHHFGMPNYLQNIFDYASFITLPEHRIELFAMFNGIAIYNDSKATTPASTLAAVQKLNNKPIRLFLGGLSKGVNRQPFIGQLKGSVDYVYCFGQEAKTLASWCHQENIPAKCFDRLEDAIQSCMTSICGPCNILFSPSGSSFDLFKDYQERGRYFKKVIQDYINVTKQNNISL